MGNGGYEVDHYDLRLNARPNADRVKAVTQQFIALAEAESGVSLTHFFDVWLFQPRRPSGW